ncbi:hypothetical protein BJX70DRAFT_141950 [Aspergillus crustosus]
MSNQYDLSYHNIPMGPCADWVRFKPAPHECPTCTLCTTGKDCPSASHPYSKDAQTGLRCYRCSACSHHAYTGNDPDLPQAHKPAPDRFHTLMHCWYVHVPLEGLGNNHNSVILRARVALAELNNGRATIYGQGEWHDVPTGSGRVMEVWMKESTGLKTVLDQAREKVKGELRDNAQVFLIEEAVGVSNVSNGN